MVEMRFGLKILVEYTMINAPQVQSSSNTSDERKYIFYYIDKKTHNNLAFCFQNFATK